MKAVHEGISFGCDKCAYETNNRSNLLRHIKSQHSCENDMNCNRNIPEQDIRGKLLENKCTVSDNNGNNSKENDEVKILDCVDNCRPIGEQGKQYLVNDKMKDTQELYKCEECEARFFNEKALLKHKCRQHQSKEKEIKCEICNVQFTRKESLREHNRSKHEGVRYPCSYCDYEATNKGHLRIHTNNIHKGLGYLCNQCNFRGTTKKSLSMHLKAVHEGIYFECDMCEYKTPRRYYLPYHKKLKHNGN